MEQTLDQIFIKHETDKSSKSHNYSPYYEMFFAPYRNEPITLLEIGVYAGASMNAWKEYFPKANIYGADISYHPELNQERVFMLEADQNKVEDMQRLGALNADIVVEDAAHTSKLQISSFETIFPMLKSGALYVIEDLLCSYDSRWNEGANVMDRIRQMVGEVQMNGHVDTNRLCSNKRENLERYPDKGSVFDRQIEWFFLASGIIFIKKI